MITLNKCQIELYEHSGEVAFIVFDPDDQDFKTMQKLGRGTPGKIYNGRLCYQYKASTIYQKA